ncbi:trypsin-like serine peptidase [Streptomyces sp. NPDC057743]|uniref:trypsin-like serine peptidase n=1 Tax=Streptomyces sp. NPDC057743 TaxID=3346236 RepID=UPI003674CED9
MNQRFAVTAAVLAVLAAASGCAGNGVVAETTVSSTSSPASPSTSLPSALHHHVWTLARMLGAHAFHHQRGVSHTSPPTTVNARVGAVFSHNGTGDHFCTGSVVDSPKKTIVITAAHCIHTGKGGSYQSDLAFVPGYRNGKAPNGVWTISKMIVDPHWAQSSDPAYDVGFVVVDKLKGKRIADVLGANRFGYNVGYDKFVKVTGYPASGDSPISCANKTVRFQTNQMKVDCTGYSGGTSGSPWLTNFDRTTRTGEVIGVIGGYQTGGSTDDTSYSPYFNDAIKSLYDKAVSAES